MSVVRGADDVSDGCLIVPCSNLDWASGSRTLTHVLDHEKLHWNGRKEPKAIRETEVEATGFVVCRYLAIESDTSDYSFLYDSSAKELLQQFETARSASNETICAITE